MHIHKDGFMLFACHCVVTTGLQYSSYRLGLQALSEGAFIVTVGFLVLFLFFKCTLFKRTLFSVSCLRVNAWQNLCGSFHISSVFFKDFCKLFAFLQLFLALWYSISNKPMVNQVFLLIQKDANVWPNISLVQSNYLCTLTQHIPMTQFPSSEK